MPLLDDQIIVQDLPQRWLITGVAGFIGSHLLRALLAADCEVVGVDNLATGNPRNLDDVAALVTPDQWRRFRFEQGDIRSAEVCRSVTDGIDVVTHQAALNSVPRSMVQPDEVLGVNVTGSAVLFRTAAEAGVKRCVYASSSAVYGDVEAALRQEDTLGNPMSPYAVSKRAGEHLAAVYERTAGMKTVGLRYFNVYGPRQNPAGPYAAVIPRWIQAVLGHDFPVINGDGTQSRDFTHVDNVVLANILAATRANVPSVCNVGTGVTTTIGDLFTMLREEVARVADAPDLAQVSPQYGPHRAGDVNSAFADLTVARNALGYEPQGDLGRGLRAAVSWFVEREVRTEERAGRDC